MQQQILILNPGNASPINENVYVTRGDDKWIYYHYGHPIYCHPAGFHRDFYLILAQLIDNGLCRECEILKTFGIPKRTLNNWRNKYAKGGVAAFFSSPNRRTGGTGAVPKSR